MLQIFENYCFPEGFDETISTSSTSGGNKYIITHQNIGSSVILLVYSIETRTILFQIQLPTKPLATIIIPFQYHNNYDETRTLCCAILLSPTIVRIVSKGSTSDIPLLIPIKSIFRCDLGIGLQAYSNLEFDKDRDSNSGGIGSGSGHSSNESNVVEDLYFISHPLAPLRRIQNVAFPKNDKKSCYEIVAIHEAANLMCMFEKQEKALYICSLQAIDTKNEEDFNLPSLLPSHSNSMSMSVSNDSMSTSMPMNMNMNMNMNVTIPTTMNHTLGIPIRPESPYHHVGSPINSNMNKPFSSTSPRKSKYSQLNANHPLSPKLPMAVGKEKDLPTLLGVDTDIRIRRDKARESMSSSGASILSNSKDQFNQTEYFATLSCRKEIKCKSLRDSIDIHTLHVSFSGGFGMLGGLLLHVIDQETKQYLTYSIIKSEKDEYVVIELPLIRNVKQVLSISHMLVSIPISVKVNMRRTVSKNNDNDSNHPSLVPLTMIEYYPIKGSKKMSSFGWLLGSQRNILCSVDITNNLSGHNHAGIIDTSSLGSQDSNHTFMIPFQKIVWYDLSQTSKFLVYQQSQLKVYEVDLLSLVSPEFVIGKCISSIIGAFLRHQMNPAAEFITAITLLTSPQEVNSIVPTLLDAAMRIKNPKTFNLSSEAKSQYTSLITYYSDRTTGTDFGGIIIETIKNLCEELKYVAYESSTISGHGYLRQCLSNVMTLPHNNPSLSNFNIEHNSYSLDNSLYIATHLTYHYFCHLKNIPINPSEYHDIHSLNHMLSSLHSLETIDSNPTDYPVLSAILVFSKEILSKMQNKKTDVSFYEKNATSSEISKPPHILFAESVVSIIMQSNILIENMSINNFLLKLPIPFQRLFDMSLSLSISCANSTWREDILRRIGRFDIIWMENTSRMLTSHDTITTKNSSISVQNVLSSNNNSSNNISGRSFEMSDGSHDKADLDGLQSLEEESKFRFPEDERVHEVIRMLRSSIPIFLKVDRSSEVSDIEYRRKLQMRLLLLCRRSLSYSVGRGMLTLGSFVPTAAEPLPFPPLVITGRVHPTNSVVALDTSAAPPELTLWPEFHNGVAAGLRIGFADNRNKYNDKEKVDIKHRSMSVTRYWILYNRTASHSNGEDAAHAGLILALGLRGHLRALSHSDVCDYLTQGHIPTAVSILLGCAASYQGSADPFISKTLCLHLPALLPPRHADIDISPLIQTAALTGLGLLHYKSKHRLMIEFFIAELCRPPTSDRCDTREAMALSAGWSLGMVLLGSGRNDNSMGSNHGNHSNNSNSSNNSNRSNTNTILPEGEGMNSIIDRLQILIDGGRRPAPESLFPWHMSGMDSRGLSSSSVSKSSRVMERVEVVNSDATSPGAIIALSLIYLRSNNPTIAKRVALPVLAFEVEDIRPDLLLFRSVGHCLILWDSVQPNEHWFESLLPKVIKDVLIKSTLSKPGLELLFLGNQQFENLSIENTARQLSQLSVPSAFLAYLSIVSGLCLGLGLIYAGTEDIHAKHIVLKCLEMMKVVRDSKLSVLTNQPRLEGKLLRPHVEMCLSVVSLASAAICAGSGDLDVMRLLRELRWKTEDVVYGTHLVLSMSLGLLFLSGGKASLRRDDFSIACLLLSFLPRFPSRTIDNQYYLQPLRHFYVLAVENRLLRVEDVDTKEQLRVNIQIERKSGEVTVVMSPCLLPELSTIKAIHFRPMEDSISMIPSNDYLKQEYYPSTLTLPSHESMHWNELPPLLLKSKSNPSNSSYSSFHSSITMNSSNSPIGEKDMEEKNHVTLNPKIEQIMDEILQQLSYDTITHTYLSSS